MRWAALAIAVVTATPAFADEQELFRLERSTNRNVVRYDAKTLDNGALDPREPVSAYWILLATNGGREGLSWIERKVAYGFTTMHEPEGLGLKLVAFDRRVLHVRRVDGKFRAELAILGRPARLERIWVQVEPAFLGPHVRWIDLHGVDLVTGKPLVERISN